MYLKSQIPASSIAEVVIAIAVIASCIGVSALIFSRTTRVTTDFETVKMQTELQSDLWKQMIQNQPAVAADPVTMEKDLDLINDSVEVLVFKGINDREIWKQHWLKSE